ncbi:hypothetical protein KIN20_025239 [Parelaphostrongylus tenuis]|uniref:Uncharacterized protein n=1 Tax=Parelaphostrongylus tenuis TaxID=148309 RepID=A0AAD5MUV9_PARTN|nr:hypothetical protein KIN20_025239 [Parelaphostrongylus tenuis]
MIGLSSSKMCYRGQRSSQKGHSWRISSATNLLEAMSAHRVVHASICYRLHTPAYEIRDGVEHMKPNDVVDVKVVVIGDTAAGKSAILRQFFDGTFDEEISSTIGIDFRHVTYQLQDGTSVRLRVWDTAGQERFRHLAPSFIRDAHVILIVFDITSPNIHEQINRWTMFAEQEQERGAVIIFVGNKCDLKQRGQNKRAMEKMMAEYGAPYMEISAKTGHNVKELFSLVAHMPFPNHKRSQSAPLRLSSTSNEKALRTSCCWR